MAIACNIRSSFLARKSTLIASKPFFTMFIDCACATLMDETLSSQALIDVTTVVASQKAMTSLE